MRISKSLILFVALTLIGCNESGTKKAVESPRPQGAASASPADQSHNLIVSYNRLLSEGYKSMNMTKLQEVATPELAQKAYYHMAALSEGKTRMVSEPKKIDFVATDCSQQLKCRVVTKELWDFAYTDIQTGQKNSEVKDYLYDVQYLVENRDGRWLITEIGATGEERKELPSWGAMFKKK